jgi:CMP-N-acetylneuraminic acid synthetase
MIIAIIPARKNSKRIKNKNIKKFNNKPMIYWTISKLKKFKIINKILVTSDSDIILKKAKKYKADICLKRPNYLATGKATTKDVIVNAIEYLKKKKYISQFSFMCLPLYTLFKIN